MLCGPALAESGGVLSSGDDSFGNIAYTTCN